MERVVAGGLGAGPSQVGVQDTDLPLLAVGFSRLQALTAKAAHFLGLQHKYPYIPTLRGEGETSRPVKKKNTVYSTQLHQVLLPSPPFTPALGRFSPMSGEQSEPRVRAWPMRQEGNLGIGRGLDFQGHENIRVSHSKFKCAPQSFWLNVSPGPHLDKIP